MGGSIDSRFPLDGQERAAPQAARFAWGIVRGTREEGTTRRPAKAGPI